TAKAIIDEMAVSGKSAAIIIEDRGLKQISDSSALEKMIDTIIDNNTALVKRYKDGDTKLLGFFIGQVMKISKGQADQAVARDIIIKKLG
ncbi:MAG: Asp-tRNA(Asn)/Glu-tRNA(Gln) amidotransferase GatCAB subunit B, partial [Candidatus Marinimicrobia bacterium]|nr:Asp-tRNA(Asn)/Glu-tRNA(Gln) amidotransferase GatCAB subunit B [Candidatus Neomarinimicrobiota bacterium]